MATIPCYMTSAAGSERSEYEPYLDRLVLHDFSQASSSRQRSKTLHKAHKNVWEGLSFNIALCALAVFFMAGLVSPAMQALRLSASAPLPALTIPVTVRPGDTLWGYAERYEQPNSYILDRVEKIANANHLPAGAALVPGERLQIPVSNPLILAQIESHRQIAER
jgi:hypothetical protein